MGSYESLKGGSTTEALEDFTGGLTEMFELKDKTPNNLLSIMLKSQDRGSLMACSINADPRQLEAELPNGLIMGHAYSVTSVKTVSDGARLPLCASVFHVCWLCWAMKSPPFVCVRSLAAICISLPVAGSVVSVVRSTDSRPMSLFTPKLYNSCYYVEISQ